MSALGVTHAKPVVVYDAKGLFSAARGWWMLRLFGHPACAVLHGGLPAWLQAGGPVTRDSPDLASTLGTPAPLEAWTVNAAMVRRHAQVVANIARTEAAGGVLGTGGADVVVDARGAGRFTGVSPEPRPWLSSGHMP
jgi:thiosulfate/3-mercaptopyruvate sulfurtransferase